MNLHVRRVRFLQEHGDNTLRTAVAKQLTTLFLVIGNTVLLDERDEVVGRVTGQRRFAKVGIGGNEVVGTGVEIGEVAAAAAGNGNLLSDAIRMLKHDDLAASFSRFDGAEKTGCPAANHNDVCLSHGPRLPQAEARP